MGLGSWSKKKKEFRRLKKRIKEGNLHSVEELKRYIDEELYDLVTYSIKKGFYDGYDPAYERDEIVTLYNYASCAKPKGFLKKIDYENMILLLKPPYPNEPFHHFT